MKIVNPLYDKAFKYLMANDKFAKKVLSVILDVEVEEVTLDQQETIFPDEKRQLTLFRLDFKAVIKEADGSRKTVLIELQKSKFSTDIQRFRNYLGANYMAKPKKREDESAMAEYQAAYPIITIYILGYNMEDLPYMAVTVNREIIDSVSKERLNVKSFFVEHLTHQSHIIQVRRLPKERRTRLEKFLTLFNQKWISKEADYILELEETPEEFADMVEYLRSPLMDESFRRNLEAEEEIDRIFDEQEAKYIKKNSRSRSSKS
ncbi:hypothetical protein Ctha_2269 [Chloroherpeton thalassium ATCC 35110]|uniref:Transposase (putative) YhgA-like domain-containing protein n=1 Tax=Chloroherpeton thalassium (strain ATCC 35110 / GB-78) TaxID=517418 RepID=B3QWG0_CHLT3|nr:hypothetical protein [Chloroherpeton thalassium]ACF14720.1 hypothetical protein Ctha_2269 [Chloroherpeton thalassium ATCC 35110]